MTDGPEGEPLLGVDYGPDISRQHHHHHHHHQQHTPITIRSALEVINKYAFLTSQYPLMVYLCHRCSPGQQRTMAQHLKKVFGSRLYTPEALPVSLGGRATTLPTPEQLKGRILLVGKKLSPDQESSEGEVSEEEEEIGGGGTLAGRRMTIPGEEDLGVVLVVPPPSQPRKLRLHKELSDLVAIARTASRSFYAQRANHRLAQQHSPPSSPSSPGTLMLSEPPYWTLCSLGEGEAGRLTTESPEDLVMFTKRSLTRVRPSSVRLDSSNPNPQGYWKGGLQLVALNQQTPGAMLDINRGRFSQNGGCGYVLRPAVMRDEVSYFSAHTQGCVPGVPPQTLRIKVSHSIFSACIHSHRITQRCCLTVPPRRLLLCRSSAPITCPSLSGLPLRGRLLTLMWFWSCTACRQTALNRGLAPLLRTRTTHCLMRRLSFK